MRIPYYQGMLQDPDALNRALRDFYESNEPHDLVDHASQRRNDYLRGLLGMAKEALARPQDALAARLAETETGATITIDVPGCAPEDVEVNVEGTSVVINVRGQVATYGFDGDHIAKESITAVCKHGRLVVTLPYKKPEVTKIAVTGE